MIESTGADYQSSNYLHTLAVSEAKIGKTVKLVADCLGVFPGQKYGGIVDKPEHLHVITVDANALGGIQKVLVDSMKAPEDALKFRVYNMQADALKGGLEGWDYTIYNTLMQARALIEQRIRKEGGVHAVILSSLTTVGAALKRALAGDAPSKRMKGSGMDMAKWDALGQQMNELRNSFASLSAHLIWEGHIFKPQGTDQSGESTKKESLQLQGSTGQNFPNNVEQILRIRRMVGEKVQGFNVDKVFFDTQPSLEFLIGGRAFNELLDPKEFDLALICHKLGVERGGWGKKSKKQAE